MDNELKCQSAVTSRQTNSKVRKWKRCKYW